MASCSGDGESGLFRTTSFCETRRSAGLARCALRMLVRMAERALEGLQRKGKIIGFRTGRGTPESGYSTTELCHCWMTEQRAA